MGDSEVRNDSLVEYLETAYENFREGAFREAEKVLEKALGVDFEDTELMAALKCANFWSSRQDRVGSIPDSYDRGEFLLKQWNAYLAFFRKDESFEACNYAVRQWVFGRALLCYKEVLEESGGHDADILLRMARCYKGLGDYQTALEYFEAANRQKTDDPQTLAELGDCYAFINEARAAKIFFREAFFLDPGRIDLASLESLMIRRLIDKLEGMGLTSPLLEEWIPVYGILFRIFNVKRELKPLEYGKLKQSIYNLENSLLEGTEERDRIVPRLINRYFWLIDHYIGTNESREKIEQVLRNVKQLDVSIYEQYVQ